MLNYTVNLFIVGVQKGGTTALHRMLTSHPEIVGGKAKELHVFDGPGPHTPIAHAAAFNASFDTTTGSARFRLDATPITCFWPQATERMQCYNPNARVIMILRHPVHRALSHWRMETVRKVESLAFETAIQREDRRFGDEAAELPSRRFSYLSRGFYAPQVRKLLNLFPRQAIRFLRTDQLWQDEKATLDGLFDWLGLEPASSRPKGQKYIVPVDTCSIRYVQIAGLDHLTDLFREDMIETARLTGLDLSDWLEFDYSEPMRSAIS